MYAPAIGSLPSSHTDLPPQKLVHFLCDKIEDWTQFGRQENMARKRHSAEQIINKLREAEVYLAEGMRVELVAKKLGVTVQTYYRWRKEYGGLKTDQVRKLKELEKE